MRACFISLGVGNFTVQFSHGAIIACLEQCLNTPIECMTQDVYTFPRRPINGRVSMSKASNVVPFRGRNGTAPNIENGKVPPPRRKNSDSRPREYLTSDEVDRLIGTAKALGRHGHRDATLILVAFRHGQSIGTGRAAMGYGGPQARSNARQ